MSDFSARYKPGMTTQRMESREEAIAASIMLHRQGAISKKYQPGPLEIGSNLYSENTETLSVEEQNVLVEKFKRLKVQ